MVVRDHTQWHIHTQTHSNRCALAHSVRLLWTSDRPVVETSTRQHTSDSHPYPLLDSIPQSQKASGHWDRLTAPSIFISVQIFQLLALHYPYPILNSCLFDSEFVNHLVTNPVIILVCHNSSKFSYLKLGCPSLWPCVYTIYM
jgi:hypothetical protein